MVNYSASLSASYQLDFWGQNRDAAQAAEETAIANRFDRDVVALTTLTSVANAYFQVLASQDRIRTAEQQYRQRDAHPRGDQGSASRPAPAPISTSRSRKAFSPTRSAAVPPLRQTLDAEHQRAGDCWCRGRRKACTSPAAR